MSESIATRVGRIISGGINQLVSAAENMAPEAVMEQAVREIDSAIDDVRTELGTVLTQKHLASKRLMETNASHEQLAERIDLAVKEQRDDLAEAAIAQQLDLEAQVPILETSIRESGERSTELEGYVVALKAKKREMNQALAEFRKSKAESMAAGAAGDTGAAGGSGGVDRRVDRATDAFDRVMEKQTGLGAIPADLDRSRQLVELEDLSRKHRIEERLAAAKARKDGGD